MIMLQRQLFIMNRCLRHFCLYFERMAFLMKTLTQTQRNCKWPQKSIQVRSWRSQKMSIKQAITQTQQRWIERSKYGCTSISCGFCDQVDGDCNVCLVPKILGFRCENLPSYVYWINSLTEPSTGLSHHKIKGAANEVLADVNQIARHYHVKQVME